jgi:hypothetical protein
LKGRICIRIIVISWIRIRIKLQMTSQNVWIMSLFEYFFKVLSLYLEARIRIRIKVTSRFRNTAGVFVKLIDRNRTVKRYPTTVYQYGVKNSINFFTLLQCTL